MKLRLPIFLLLVGCFQLVSEFAFAQTSCVVPYNPTPVSTWGMVQKFQSSAVIWNGGTPTAADLNGDGISEILAPAKDFSGYYVFKGDGANKTTATKDFVITTSSIRSVQPAIANIIGNASSAPEVVMVNASGFLYIFTNTGGTESNFLYKSTTATQYTLDVTPYIVDIDEDGIAEIVLGNDVFGIVGNALVKRIAGPALGYIGATTGATGTAIDVIVADIISTNPGKELIYGSRVYGLNLSTGVTTKLKDLSTIVGSSIIAANDNGPTAIGDMNGDGKLDIVYNGSTFVVMWDPNGTTAANTLLFRRVPPSFNFGVRGLPLIANVYNDISTGGKSTDYPEAVIINSISGNAGIVTAYNLNYNTTTGTATQHIWSFGTNDMSGSTGITAFDFDGNGIREIVYRDQSTLRVINGNRSTPLNYATEAVASSTWGEYPIVADLNNDGQAEIAVTGDDRLQVFGSDPATFPWKAAPNYWNQRNYRIVNINSNLTVPSTEINATSSVAYNNNAAQFQFSDAVGTGIPTGSTYVADAQITINTVTTNCPTLTVAATISNSGAYLLPAGTFVAMYDANPTTGAANLIGTYQTTTPIAAGASGTVSMTANIVAPSTTIFAVVNDRGTSVRPFNLSSWTPNTGINECSYTNNMDSEAFTCLDTDGDSVVDYVDIDDDNDGVLDITEQSGSCTSVTLTPFSATSSPVYGGSTANRTIDGSGFTGTGLTALASAPAVLENAWLLKEPETSGFIEYLMPAGSNVGGVALWAPDAFNYGGGDGPPKDFTVELTYEGGRIFTSQVFTTAQPNSSGALPGGQTFYFTKALSNVSKIRLNILSGWYDINNNSIGQISTDGIAVNAAYNMFLGEFRAICGLADLDTDNDGIPNRLDLDSDGDGCTDAVEAGVSGTLNSGSVKNGVNGNVTSTNTLPNAIAAGLYGTNGLANSLETTADNGVINYPSSYAYATLRGFAACADADGDGVNDVIDLDDDNDGILDNTELSCTSPLNAVTPTLAGATSIFSDNNTGTFLKLGGATVSKVSTTLYGTSIDVVQFSGTSSGAIVLANAYQQLKIAVADVDQSESINLKVYDVLGNLIQLSASNILQKGSYVNPTYPAGSSMVLTAAGALTYDGSTSTISNILIEIPYTAKRIEVYKTAGSQNSWVGLLAGCNDGDTDNDGIPNRLDLDSDGDGCSDALESGATTSGTANFAFTGAMGTNGLVNSLETVADNGTINYTSTYDFAISKNYAACVDTDGDSVTDVNDVDDDNDGVLDVIESPTCFYTKEDWLSGNRSDITVSTSLAMNATYGNPSKLVDGNKETAAASYAVNFNASTTAAQTVYAFRMPIPVELKTIYLGYVNTNTHFNANTVLRLEGSNDNTSWAALSANTYGAVTSVPGITGTITANTFTVTQNSGKYLYYRIYWVSGGGVNANGYSNEVYFETFANYQPSLFPKLACISDSDGDGILNHQDLDSDGDGCPDAREAGVSGTLNAGTISNKVNGVLTATPNVVGVIANGIYGANGFANSLETATESGSYTGTYTYSYAISNTINACLDTDSDGVVDVIDIDDDNDGVLDVLECSPFDINNLSYLPIAYTVTNGTSASQTFPAAPEGLVVNVWTLDNSFNIKINGTNLVTPAELEFYPPVTTNSVFEFLDGTAYGSVWGIVGSPSKPLIRVYINKFGAIKVFGSKTSNGNLEEMRLRTGAFNTITLNRTATNTFVIGQNVIGTTYITGDYGVINSTNCDFDGDGIPNDQDLDSDGDGCSDAIEAGSSTNATSISVYPTGTDTNANGLLNDYEGNTAGTVNYLSTYSPYALSSTLNACLDTDVDGVPDLIDIDDDNDGILDAVESPTCFYTAVELSQPISISTELAPYSTNLVGRAIDGNAATASAFNANQDWVNKEIFKFTAKNYIAISGMSFDLVSWPLSSASTSTFKLQGSGDNLTWTDLSQPTFSSAGTGTFTITNSLAAATKFKYFRILGVAGSSFYGGVNEARFNLASSFVQSQYTKPACSTGRADGDLIPNHLDLDSDGDGCSDALEAGTTTNTTADYKFTGTGTDFGANGFFNTLEKTAAESNLYSGVYTYDFVENSEYKSCIDTDADGITDIIDIDDDNDGILDAVESPTCFYTIDELKSPATISSELTQFSSYVIGNAIDGVGTTASAFNANQDWVNKEIFKFTAKNYIVISGMSFDLVNWALSSAAASTFKLQGSGDNLTWTDLSTATFSSATTGTFTISNTLSTTTKFKYFRILGVAGSSFYGGVYEARFNLAASTSSSANPKPTCSTGITDGDLIPNHLDLDSDGDGCSDAFEAGTTSSATANFVHTTTMGTNGFADALQTTGNGIYNGLYTYYYANNAVFNACADTDTDGVKDIIDVDDDNDGILDAVESPTCFTSSAEASLPVSVTSELDIYNNNLTSRALDNNTSTFSAFNPSINWVNKDIFRITPNVVGPLVISGVKMELVNWAISSSTSNTFKLQGSLDNGTTWVDLSAAVSSTLTTGSFTISNTINPTVGYSLFRITGVAGVSFYGGVTELSLVLPGSFQASKYPKATCTRDTDSDGKLNHQDLDSDGDGCSDAKEAGLATNTTSSAGELAGPYGTNGFVDALETTTDNGVYRGTYVYKYALSATENACLDTDSDGLGDLLDIDDDNDGILDLSEQTNCITSGIPINTLTFSGSAITASTASTVSSAGGDYWRTSYSDQNLKLPISLSYKFNSTTGYAMFGLFPVTGTQNAGTWADGGYKFYPQTTNVYGYFTTAWDFGPISITSNDILSIDISATGYVTAKVNGIVRKAFQGVVSDYKLNMSSYRAANFADVVLTDANNLAILTCTDLDTDTDGIPNRLDLDSDGDGCADAVEAGGSTTATSISAFPTGTDSNANGLLDNYETGTTGTVNYTSTYSIYALVRTVNACTDTDSDGVKDLVDLDDDNDGVLDSVECPSPVYTLYTYNYPTASNATNVPVNILGLNSQDVLLDQRTNGVAPNAFTFNSISNWKLVATNIQPSISNTVTVRIAPTASTSATYVFADAMLLTNGVNTYVIDNNSTNTGGFNLTGTWSQQNVSNAYNTTNSYLSSPSYAGNTATWTFSDLPVPPVCDTDGDGVPNIRDLDSDGDGCSDAVEAKTVSSLTATTVSGGFGTNGFADNLETSGNGVYTGTYVYSRATDPTVKACLDSDFDGVPDVDDLDDDNDGILDSNENGPFGCVQSPACVNNASLSASTSSTGTAPTGWTNFGNGGSVDINQGNWQISYGQATPSRTLFPAATANTFFIYGMSKGGSGGLGGWAPYGEAFQQTLNCLTVGQTYYLSFRGAITHSPGVNAAVSYETTPTAARFVLIRDGTQVSQAPDQLLEATQQTVTLSFVATSTTHTIAIAHTADRSTDLSLMVIEAGSGYLCTSAPAAINENLDTDGDGIPNRLDLDSDGDGCSDANEAYNSSTAQGTDGNQYYGTGNPPAVDATGKVTGANYTSTSVNVLTVGRASTITAQPTNQTVETGATTSFAATVTEGSGTTSYQWELSTNGGSTWSNITNAGVYSGATTRVLTVTGVTSIMNEYRHRLQIAQSDFVCGNLVTNVARLILSNNVTIINDNVSTLEDTPSSGNVLTNDVGSGTPAASLTVSTFTISGVTYPAGTTATINGVGTIVVNTNGSYTFTPELNYTGAVPAVTYVATESTQSPGSGTGTLTITITPVNDPPVAVDDVIPATEDTPVSGNILTNDTDPEANTLSVSTFQIGSLSYNAGTTATLLGVGTIVVNADGTYTFTPVSNYSGNVPDIFYTITDGNGGTDTGLIDIVVSSVNDNPTAINDNFTISEDSNATGNVLSNDSDPEGSSLSVTQFTIFGVSGTFTAGTNPVTIPNVGSIVLNTDGSFTFTPLANYNGTAPVISYTASDGNGGTATGTLTIVVTPVNDAPLATPDTNTVNEDTAATGNVLTNDTDSESNPLSITQLSAVVNGTTLNFAPGQSTTLSGIGTIVVATNGDYTFTPNANWNGTVPTITYSVSDGNGGTASGTLAITVTPVNDAPLATDDVFSVPQRLTVSGNIIDNDTDVDTPKSSLRITSFTVNSVTTAVTAGTAVTYTIGIQGTLTVNANGDFTFVPESNFSGKVSEVTYTLSDGALTDLAKLQIVVIPVPDAPTAGNDAQTVLEDGTLSCTVSGASTCNLLANDSVDPDFPLLTLSITQISFTVGTTTYTYPEGVTAEIPGVGTIKVNANGTYEFKPTKDYNGVVPPITYTITDGEGNKVTADLSITITPVNDTPIALNESFSTVEDTNLSGNVLANDSDADGNTLTVTQFTIFGVSGTFTAGTTSASIPSVGSIVLDTNGSFTFTPVANYNGTAPVITYTLSDGNGGSASANLSIVVTPVNDAPVANADTNTVNEDTAATGNVLTNDTDAEANTLSVSQLSVSVDGVTINFAPGQSTTLSGIGTIVVAANGAYTFTPNANWNGTVPPITYTISDGNGGTASSTLAITVTPVNDTPIGVNDNFTIAEDGGALTGNIRTNDSDVEGGTLTITAYSIAGLTGPFTIGIDQTISDVGTDVGTIRINADGTFSFTPAANYNGTVPAITYTLSDGTATATANLMISVSPVNDPPLVTSETPATPENTPISGNLLANDSDRESNSLVITQFTVNNTIYSAGSIVDLPNVGTVIVNADGTYTFTPVTGYFGTLPVITYAVSDGNGGSTNGTLAITVTPVNDPPVVSPESIQIQEDAVSSGNLLINDTDPENNTLTISQFTIAGVTGTFTPGSTAVTIPNVGTIQISANGDYVFTPAANYNGIVPNIEYTVSDGLGGTTPGNLTIVVEAVNDAPTVTNDTKSESVNTPIVGNVLSNDWDIEGTALGLTKFTIGGVDYPAGTTATIVGVGTVVINADGTYTFTPATNYIGSPPVITYTVSDGTATSPGTLSLTITPIDADGDGIPDATEKGTGATPRDSDNDTIPDYLDTDSDNDGIPDAAEDSVCIGFLPCTPTDTDGDGTPDYRDLDSDGDGISDAIEGTTDTDGDGIPNYQDTDSDGDGILDSVEKGPTATPVDTDLDGTPDYRDLDSDGDGIPDATEGALDTDADGVPNFRDLDSDEDGILDAVEGTTDTDADGTPNYLDTDSDGDGISDLIEKGPTATPVDTDGDGTPDYKDLDSDNDGILDSVETAADTDSDGIPNFRDLDSDGDGILDAIEGTLDSDGDGTPNYRDVDSDGDGIPDSIEKGTGSVPVDTDGDGTPDYLDLDTDGDGIPDAVEDAGCTGTAPCTPTDTDGDGTPNFRDLDSDGDGLTDAVEKGPNGATPVDTDGDTTPDYLDVDSDGDGISDAIEKGTGITPLDTDGDGIPDYRDTDSDNDGILDSVEKGTGTSPVDTDNDGTPDYRDLDSDGDGKSDQSEGTVDTDNDGTPNYLDLDSDGDGVLDAVDVCPLINGLGSTNGCPPDSDGDGLADVDDSDDDNDGILDTVEAAACSPSAATCDTDGDGIPNILDTDSDGDGISDVIEAGGTDADRDGKADGAPDVNGIPASASGGLSPPNTDGTGNSNPYDTDSDGDGILDAIEKGTGATLADTDNDLIPDYLETDSDDDGISDAIEKGTGTAVADTDGDGTPDYRDLDSDGDGIPDSIEKGSGATPVDSDNDGIPNFRDVDSDGDGILDSVEDAACSGITPCTPTDTDGDNTPDYLDLDSDADGIPDAIEGTVDTDRDGLPDYLDTDSDGDGILDSVEDAGCTGTMPCTPTDTDGDGIPNFRDLDSDADGITDAIEGTTDTDGDLLPNYLDPDSDGDGISDLIEGNVDSDNDGTPNYKDLDSDGDGIPDAIEKGTTTTPVDTDSDGTPDYLDTDTDGDGIPDSVEDYSCTGTAPCTPTDTDGDGIPNHKDLDSDGDGIPDSVEKGASGASPDDTDGTTLPNYLDTDSDDDGILDEVERGLDGNSPLDTDGDGTPDYKEVDSDGDGISDAIEGTVDTDGDGIPNYRDTDSDNDGILDSVEKGSGSTPVDTDNDGTPDYKDLDSDGDNKSDQSEGISDFDGDGTPNYLDLDSDADGVNDNVDMCPLLFGTHDRGCPIDSDGDGIYDIDDLDDDNDGLLDTVEAAACTPTAVDCDTDGDGIPNRIDPDSDNDGISDVRESNGTDVDGDGKVDGTVDVNGVPSSTNGGLTPPNTDGTTLPDPYDTDSDGDGISDSLEGTVDTDGDGIPNYRDLDSDADGIPDSVEKGTGTAILDTDGDGIPDYKDLDSDNDGILDTVEKGPNGATPLDTDGDGIPNYRDLDSDGDGIPDSIEKGTGSTLLNSDGDALPDYLDTDSDGDGISDAIEKGLNGNSPIDTDGDGIPDYRDTDSDNDGIPDSVEKGTGTTPVDTDGDGVPNYRDLDSDGDGITDAVEKGANGATPVDTDSDGSPDYVDLDSDGDGKLDAIEKGTGSTLLDTDRDGIPDYRDVDNYGQPDVNVTDVNVPVVGNVKTNDAVPAGTTYGQPAAIAGATLVMDPTTGTYTFTSATPGTYEYLIPVCGPNQTTNCPLTPLQITVLDPLAVDKPVANNDFAILVQGGSATVAILANDKAGDLGKTIDASSLVILTAPTHGTAVVNSDGTITYTPSPFFVGVDRLEYRVCDTNNPAQCQTATVYFTVEPAGLVVKTGAVDDFAIVRASPDGSANVTGNLLSNDLNGAGATLTANLVTGPTSAQGTFTLNANGTYSFTPAAGFTGPVDIVYEACGGSPVVCTKATLHILVEPMPTLVNDTNSAFANVPKAGDLSTNDTKPAGTTYGQPAQQAGATLTVNADGTYSITATAAGTYTYTIPVCAPGQVGTCPTQTLVVTVTAPSPVNDTNTAFANVPKTGDLSTNDTNPVGSTYGQPAQQAGATLTVNADGTYSFTATAAGTYTYTVPVCAPGQTVNCPTQTLTITVTAPSPVNDTDTAFANVPKAGNLATNDTNPVGSTYGQPAQQAGATLTVNADGTYSFTATAAGTYTYTIPVCAPGQTVNCPTQTLTITVTAPSLVNDTNTAFANVPKTGNLSTNDTNPAGSTYGQPAQQTGATLMVNADGTYSFTATAAGTYTYTIPVCAPGQTANCPTQTLEITVTAPSLVNDTNTAFANVPKTANLATNDTNPAGSTYGQPAQQAGASLTVNADGTYSFTATAEGTYTYTIPVCAPGQTSNCPTQTLTITVTAPSLVNDTNTALANIPKTGNLATNDTNPAGSTYGQPAQQVGATLTVNADGTYSFTATAAGTYTYTIPVCAPGQTANCPTQTLTITVTAPILVNDTNTAFANVPKTGDLATNDTNPVGSTYGQPAQQAGATLTVNADGTYSFTATAAGTYTYTIPVCAPGQTVNCPTQTLTITVTAPILVNDTNTAFANVPKAGDLATNDTNPAGTTYGQPAQQAGATLTVNADGTYSFTATAAGTYTYTIPVCAPGQTANCPTQTLTVTVTAPILVNDTNTAFANVPKAGNLATNDTNPVGSTYGQPAAITGATIVVNADGTYSFTGTVAGIYTYTIPVCAPGQTSNCPTQTLEIKVTGNNLVAGLDNFQSNQINGLTGGIAGNVLANDALDGKPIVASQVVITIKNDGGLTGVVIDKDGNLILPAGVSRGTYVVIYTICDAVDPTNCKEAMVIVEVFQPVELKVTKFVEAPEWFEGDEFTYTIRVENTGKTTATAVVVKDNLPVGLRYVSSVSSQVPVTTQVTGQEITWNITQLPIAGSTNITLKVKAAPLSDGKEQTLLNTASVSSKEREMSPADNTSSVPVKLKPFFIPNTITPNGGGINDTFEIPGLGRYVSNELVIMNRWGDQVFERKNYQNDWGAEGLVSGTYFYILKVTDEDGKEASFKGFVEVVKERIR